MWTSPRCTIHCSRPCIQTRPEGRTATPGDRSTPGWLPRRCTWSRTPDSRQVAAGLTGRCTARPVDALAERATVALLRAGRRNAHEQRREEGRLDAARLPATRIRGKTGVASRGAALAGVRSPGLVTRRDGTRSSVRSVALLVGLVHAVVAAHGAEARAVRLAVAGAQRVVGAVARLARFGGSVAAHEERRRGGRGRGRRRGRRRAASRAGIAATRADPDRAATSAAHGGVSRDFALRLFTSRDAARDGSRPAAGGPAGAALHGSATAPR
jgi:hypothetical protein